jgi:hypothetical protein
MQAFFVSAIKVWNDIISGKDVWKVKIEEKEDEEKKEGSSVAAPSLSTNSSRQNIENQSIFESKSKIIKPLLVAKEKFFHYFKVRMNHIH